jgi:hypothetical protein
VKKFVLAITVLAMCSASFAQVPGFPLIGAASPILAQTTAAPQTTNCAFTFQTGANNAFLQYCVTPNGNVTQIETPFGHQQMGPGGEGYGICNESPAQDYNDYAVSDTGNWGTATVLSKTTAAIKIARTTSDGHWTLTQTITKVPKTSSITIVMGLTNNQAVDKVAYLLRYADVNADGVSDNVLGATLNGTFAWSINDNNIGNPPFYGLQLQNVGTPPFGFWRAYAKVINSGPNACAFAANDSGGIQIGEGSLVLAYTGTVPAGQTKTVTLTYRGL